MEICDDTNKTPMVSINMQIRHHPELQFTVVADPYNYYVEYTVYNIEAWKEAADGSDQPMYRKAGPLCHPDLVDSLEESEPYLHGSVRSTGCSNWYFDRQDREMLHGCSKADVQRFSDVMAMCWDWTADLCGHWNP